MRLNNILFEIRRLRDVMTANGYGAALPKEDGNAYVDVRAETTRRWLTAFAEEVGTGVARKYNEKGRNTDGILDRMEGSLAAARRRGDNVSCDMFGAFLKGFTQEYFR